VGPPPPREPVDVAEAGPALLDARRLRLFPVDAEWPPSSSSPSSPSSFIPVEAEPGPLMLRLPGILFELAPGPGILIGPDRPIGVPTGRDEGSEPCGALRQA
jgi:hypothetical protein